MRNAASLGVVVTRTAASGAMASSDVNDKNAVRRVTENFFWTGNKSAARESLKTMPMSSGRQGINAAVRPGSSLAMNATMAASG
jgi:hypothetical protein